MDAINVNVLIKNIRNDDVSSRNELIESNKGFIRRISSYICKRSLDWSNDDELSIALLAFNEAIDSYNPDKGVEFTSYCRVLIKNRLIDYFRKNKDIHISINSFNDEELSAIENKEALDRYSLSYAAQERSFEVKMFNTELKDYGISIIDLTQNSPKHKDTRRLLYEAALKCSTDKDIMKTLKKNKMLPIKEIMELSDVKRKFLEQWRRYLIALLVIMSSDEYLYLKQYINFD